MQSLATILRLGAVAVLTTAAAAQPAATSSATAAQQLVDRIGKAWSGGDAAAYAALFAPDARMIGRSGNILDGNAEIRKFFTELWAGPLKGARWSGQVVNSRQLGADYLLVETASEATGYRTPPPGVIETSPGVLRSRGTMILARQGNDWRIVRSQTTAVAAPEQSAARSR